MHKTIALLTGAILALSLQHTAAQTQVTQGVMNGKKYGVTYILPKSQLRITVEATKHVYEPGRFSSYAQRYLRLNDVKQEASQYWTLDRATVTSVGVADKDNVFFVEMKDRTTAPLMELTREGIVRSINLPFEGDQAVTPTQQTVEEVLPAPESFLTEEVLMATSTAKMAELVAKEIYTIRESRNDLLRGEAENTPKDGAQLQIMLDNLDKQERSLLQMFQGKETTTSQTFTVDIEPEELDNAVVARFSDQFGLVDKDDLSGDPLYLSVKGQNLNETTTEETADGKQGKTLSSILGGNKKGELEGVAYNVPGKASVTLAYQHQTLCNIELPLTQFGTREYLAEQLFNKNTVTKVRFDVNTGGILKIDRADDN